MYEDQVLSNRCAVKCVRAQKKEPTDELVISRFLWIVIRQWRTNRDFKLGLEQADYPPAQEGSQVF